MSEGETKRKIDYFHEAASVPEHEAMNGEW